MGREVRMVPADWVHPKYQDDYHEHHLRGRHIALLDSDYEDSAKDWDESYEKWQEGLVRDYGHEEKTWRAKNEDELKYRFSDWEGSRPSPDDYMPSWDDSEKTHLMMYETTSEGTPLSPVFETPEELARWLADNNASSFGDQGATYEQWLSTCKSGWAPSAVFTPQTGIVSGVEAIATREVP